MIGLHESVWLFQHYLLPYFLIFVNQRDDKLFQTVVRTFISFASGKGTERWKQEGRHGEAQRTKMH